MSTLKNNKKLKYKVYSLFTGAGGFDIGFEEAGFEVIGASDIWKESEKTMNLNYPNIPFICKEQGFVNYGSRKQCFSSTSNFKQKFDSYRGSENSILSR